MHESTLTASNFVQSGLAHASLEVGAMALFVLGGIFTLTAVKTLLKRNSNHRP